MFVQKARRADKNIGRGETPAKEVGNRSPEGATERSCVPSVASQQSWSLAGVTPLPVVFTSLRDLHCE